MPKLHLIPIKQLQQLYSGLKKGKQTTTNENLKQKTY